jgi:hypothetical protein
MGVMSRLAADTQAHSEQAEILRDSLKMAAARMQIMAERCDDKEWPHRSVLYRRWAAEAKHAAEVL